MRGVSDGLTLWAAIALFVLGPSPALCGFPETWDPAPQATGYTVPAGHYNVHPNEVFLWDHFLVQDSDTRVQPPPAICAPDYLFHWSLDLFPELGQFLWMAGVDSCDCTLAWAAWDFGDGPMECYVHMRASNWNYVYDRADEDVVLSQIYTTDSPP